MASRNSLRWIIRPSGLFDTGNTDLSTLDVVTESDILKAAVDQSDLFPMLNDVVTEEGDLVPSPGFDVMGDTFFDAFTDLTAFLEGEESSQTSKEVTVFDAIACDAVTSNASTHEEDAVVRSEKTPRKRKREKDYDEGDDDEERKKSKVIEVTSSRTKPAKYRERRDKNNIASKRSRETRKMKDSEMEQKAVELEESNNKLKETIEELTAHTEFLRKKLIETLSSRGVGQNKT
ncbi:uncharacterized protein LOC144449893 [Glandiceps talaboti]